MGPNDHIGAKSWNFNAPQHGNFTQISYRHAKKLCAQLCVRVFRWRSLDPPESFGKSLLIMCARKRVSAFYAFEKLCKNISISVNSDETFPMYCKLLLTCSLKPNMTSVVQQSRSNETDSLSPTQSTFSPTVSFETEALYNRHWLYPFVIPTSCAALLKNYTASMVPFINTVEVTAVVCDGYNVKIVSKHCKIGWCLCKSIFTFVWVILNVSYEKTSWKWSVCSC